jgi:hypothetical protein
MLSEQYSHRNVTIGMKTENKHLAAVAAFAFFFGVAMAYVPYDIRITAILTIGALIVLTMAKNLEN